jgi:hypothetical protein
MKRRHLIAVAFAVGLLLALIRLLNKHTSGKSESKTEVLEVMPVKLGAKKTAFQLNTFLPQVHLTLISVLQGVALGVLIAQFGVVSPLSFPSVLLYMDSIFIIALVWYLYAWAFVAFQWPFSSWHTVLQFILAFAQSLAFAFLSKPAIWTLGIACSAFVGAFIRWLNTKVVSSAIYEREDIFHYELRVDRGAALQLAAMGVFLSIAGSWLIYRYSECLTVVIGLLLMAVLVLMIGDAQKVAAASIRKHLEASPWAFDEHGQLIEREDYSDIRTSIQ